MSQSDIDRRSVRATLIDEFAALSSDSLVNFQRSLADALVEGESGNNKTSSEDIDRHLHLLRCIGDALAWQYIPAHTIRTLNYYPGPPPSITGQRDSLNFVFSVAEQCYQADFRPIITDLTHLIRVGDIVAVRPGHQLILECKDSPPPRRLAQAGRRKRQRERGERRARYLRQSYLDEPSGQPRIVIPGSWPDPTWDSLTTAVRACDESSDGFGMCQLGPGDWLIALDRTISASVSALEEALQEIGPQCKRRMMGFSREIMLEPPNFVPSPLTYPLPSSKLVALLEGELFLLRAIDLAEFDVTSEVDGQRVELRLTDPKETFPLDIKVGDTQSKLSFRFNDLVLYSPTPIKAAVQSAINTGLTFALHYADPEPPDTSELARASGDPVSYGTVYKGKDGQSMMFFQESELEPAFAQPSPSAPVSRQAAEPET